MNQPAMDWIPLQLKSNGSTSDPLLRQPETAAKPHTAAVVVAMAGTMRPATNFTCEQLWAWRILAFVKQTMIRANNDS